MYTNICIEGIDKSGKGIVAEYIKRLSCHKYTVFDRGVMSEIVYSKIFNRKQKFDTEPYKRFVFVYLTLDKEDWKIRCAINNEPEIDFDLHTKTFNKVVEQFKKDSFYVVKHNTSNKTPYQIAREVIEFMDEFNKFENN